MSDSNAPPNPIDDAEKIRLKRLAKLGSSVLPSPGPSKQSQPTPALSSIKKSPPNVITQPTPSISTQKKKTTREPVPLDRAIWDESMIEDIFRVTIHRAKAQDRNWQYVWLKGLQTELEAERASLNPKLTSDDVDRVLIARLEIDPNAMSDDLDYLPVIASLPSQQTTFEYLVGCWKRLQEAKAALSKQFLLPDDANHASILLEKIRDLAISYVGLTMQDPTMFPQPPDKPLGAPELLPSLLSAVSLSSPLSDSSSSHVALDSSEIDGFITDLERRFPSSDEGLDEILGPVVRLLLFNEILSRPEGLAGGDSGWRTVLAGLSNLVRNRSIANMITRLEEWCPEDASASNVERVSLLGPLSRLGVFEREWPSIAKTYYSDPEKRSRADVDSSNNSLRTTLNALQSSLFQVLNSMVRSSVEAREAVLHYFGRIVSLNVKRGGLQVDYSTVSSDGFLINLQAILLRFAEPFIDATFSKLDKIDPTYLAQSSRMALDDETRINTTADDHRSWSEELQQSLKDYRPNFITEIFYLTMATNHFGLMRTIQFEQELHKAVDDRQGLIGRYNSDPSWQGSAIQARIEADIERLKNDISRIHAEMFAYQAQLLDPSLVSKNLAFIGFLSTWLLRLVDIRKQHPHETIDLPLPTDAPIVFKMLPEFCIDDIAEYYLYLMRHNPELVDSSSRIAIVNLCLTFLSSTWYIKNPFLKAKLVQVLFYGTLGSGRNTKGVLSDLLNSHPLSLRNLMPALTGFYIEVESTGSHSQFYDKFNSRRDISYILNAIWNTPGHREALKRLSSNLDMFVRFINLMMNDVTFLLDESLGKLTEISAIQGEMEQDDWASKPARHKQERLSLLHSLGGQATSWLSLGKSTVDLLEKFTQETKAPFTTPEIVGRLAAMLNYNLDALVGPRCQDLRVKNPEKYRFNPRQLLSDILQVYLNLSAEPDFIQAVASDGRSYKASLFDRAAAIARKRALKSDDEVEKLRIFVEKVEEQRLSILADEEDGEVPDEFLDPLMFTIMRDPVILPSSRTVIDRSTIKAHLLSDSTDPFNRVPLKIENVVPNPELKRRIEEFLLERRAHSRRAHTSSDVGDINMNDADNTS